MCFLSHHIRFPHRALERLSEEDVGQRKSSSHASSKAPGQKKDKLRQSNMTALPRRVRFVSTTEDESYHSDGCVDYGAEEEERWGFIITNY